MDCKLSRILILAACLLLISVPAWALDGTTEDEIGVKVEVEPYAEVEPGSIAGDDWMPGTIEDGEADPKDSFSGKPGETRWAQTQVAIKANTDVSIKFNPQSFPNEQLNEKWYKIFVSSLEKGNEGRFVSNGGESWNEEWVASGDAGTSQNVFDVKVQATMPDEFWKVKADTYKGTINVTVSAM